MTVLPRALTLALGQMLDPAILRVLGKTIAITLALFVAVGFALYFGLEQALAYFSLDGGGFASAALATVIAIVSFWLLFRLVALAVLQFFAEDVVRAVEARHYRDEASVAREIGFAEGLRHSSGATMRAILANAAALPVAALLAPTGLGAPLVFWLVNAVLLGRELQDMVWLRYRLDETENAPVGALTRFALGGVVAGLLAVPVVNFIAPVLGAASATHLVHRGRAKNA